MKKLTRLGGKKKRFCFQVYFLSKAPNKSV